MVERETTSDLGSGAAPSADAPARLQMLDGDIARRIVETAMEKVLERAATEEGRDARTSSGGNFEARLSAVETRLGQVETRLAVVETKLETVVETTVRLEARLDRFETATLAAFAAMRKEIFDSFATLRRDTDASIAALRRDSEASFAALRRDTEAAPAATRKDTDAAFVAMRKDTDAAFAAVRKDMAASREHTDASLAMMRHDMDASFKDVRDHARGDFRLLFGALIAVALGLAGMMAKGFHWL